MTRLNSQLTQFLGDYPAASYLLAFSGGLDSHVLLHGLARLRTSIPGLVIRAIHIDHGLQSESAAWQRHCQYICDDLGVSLEIISLGLQPEPGQSIEAIAHEARYQVFADHIQADEILLTAHHQDDQAETLLLNLLRGAGAAGLAAMPQSRVFHDTLLCRPLLNCSQQELQSYAREHQLNWIEDPSNQSLAFDRNYLRHEIFPRLQGRWPAVAKTLSRAAQWQTESHELLSGLVQQKLTVLTGSEPYTLSVPGLLNCEEPLQKAILRQWLSQLGFTMPSAVKLKHVMNDVLIAKVDAKPCVSWTGCEIRRYRGEVYALSPLPTHDPAQSYPWPDYLKSLPVPSLGITINKDILAGFVPLLAQTDLAVHIGFRQGGEKLLLSSGKHISLKNFLQNKQVPPWERSRVPLVYLGKTIIAIPGYFTLTRQQLLTLIEPSSF